VNRVPVGKAIELAVHEWGAPGAPSIVLLHGGGLSSAEWTALAPELALDHHVVAFDARGCGASDRDPELRYGAATIAADLETVRDQLALSRFAIVGHSFGAVAACVYAADRPGAVTGVVLLDGGPADHTRPASLDDPPLFFASRNHAAAALAVMLPRGFPDWYLNSRFETLSDGTLTWRSDMAGRVEWSRAGGEPLIRGLWPYVEAIRSPTLVVHGADSALFPLATAVRMAEVNPLVRVLDVPDAGHFVHIDQPAVVLRAIRQHLA
jgi:esterase